MAGAGFVLLVRAASVALATFGCAVACDAPPATSAPPLVVGLSNMSVGIEDLAVALEVRWVRQTIGWDAVERVAAPSSLTLAEARSDAALVAYVSQHDLSEVDALVERFTARDMQVVAGVGSGWSQALPRLADGRPVAPDTLGRETYLAWQVLVTRAIVERFDGDGFLDAPSGARVVAWQVENELNEAVVTALGGARFPGGVAALSSAWADEAWVDTLLVELVAAVRAADPGAIVLTNLHVSVGATLDRALGVPPWDERLVRWRPLLDWIGLDAYPNYLVAAPLATHEIGRAVRRAVSLADGRPVYVIETGYPSGPRVLGYDEAKQATFLRAAFAEARDAGAAGFFWYGTRTRERTTVGIDARDLDTLRRLATAYAEGDLRAIVNLMVTDAAYFEGHFAAVLAAKDAYWGLVREDGTPKLAWDALACVVQRDACP